VVLQALLNEAFHFFASKLEVLGFSLLAPEPRIFTARGHLHFLLLLLLAAIFNTIERLDLVNF